ncbi:hypothetical protein YB2330_004605 [Saitoella coloradoensis]
MSFIANSIYALFKRVSDLQDADAVEHIPPVNPNCLPRLILKDGEKAPRVLIIGGGLAGMSAALELSERGFEVVIREVNAVLGGRLDSKKAQPLLPHDPTEFYADHGFHAWFVNSYHQFGDIINRLGLNDQLQAWEKTDIVFRNYSAEAIVSHGPYPLNLINVLRTSTNMNYLTSLRIMGIATDSAFYDYSKIYEDWDEYSVEEWAEKRGIDKAYYDIVVKPVGAVTLSKVQGFSAAEMQNMMQIFFLAGPGADVRFTTKQSFYKSLLEPWRNRLLQNGVRIETSTPVKALRMKDGVCKGIDGEPETYDYTIMAADLPGAKSILEGTVDACMDEKSKTLATKLREPVSKCKIAPPYKILKVWLKGLLPADKYPAIIETPEHSPLNEIVQYHMLQDEYKEFAAEKGIGCWEFHLYALEDKEWSSLTEAKDVWKKLAPIVFEIVPEMADFEVRGYHMNQYENFPDFSKGQHKFRPQYFAPSSIGIKKLVMAGDWLQTSFPSFIMERAVSTGRLAANEVLREHGVREVELRVVSSYGPGFAAVGRKWMAGLIAKWKGTGKSD